MSLRHLDKGKDVWRTPSKNDPMQRLKIIETLQCTDYISNNCEQQSKLINSSTKSDMGLH